VNHWLCLVPLLVSPLSTWGLEERVSVGDLSPEANIFSGAACDEGIGKGRDGEAMSNILCKVTSRGRPSELLRCVGTYLALANHPQRLRWLFTFDLEDAAYRCNDFDRALRSLVPDAMICFGHSAHKVHALNRDLDKVQAWNWQILLTISDDQWAEKKGWDTLMKEQMPKDLDASLWTFDGRQRRINTQEILGRTYFERFHYVYYPQYRSFFCDDEATRVAGRLGKQVVVDEVWFKHFHYGWDLTHFARDATYRRAEVHFQHDLQLFTERAAADFFLNSATALHSVPTPEVPAPEMKLS
jgi:hypothetical protein